MEGARAWSLKTRHTLDIMPLLPGSSVCVCVCVCVWVWVWVCVQGMVRETCITSDGDLDMGQCTHLCRCGHHVQEWFFPPLIPNFIVNKSDRASTAIVHLSSKTRTARVCAHVHAPARLAVHALDRGGSHHDILQSSTSAPFACLCACAPARLCACAPARLCACAPTRGHTRARARRPRQ